MNLLSVIGLLNPYLLLSALPLAAALIFAYLRRGKGPLRVVPSLLILRTVKTKKSARRLFIPPRRFFFELLLLALLAAGIGGVYLSGQSESIAIIIDNSLSMGAIAPRSHGQSTFLAEAKSEAQAFVDSLPSESEVSIFVTSPILRAIAKNTNPSGAKSQLGTVVLSYGADRLEQLSTRMEQFKEFHRIKIFSDANVFNSQSNSRIGFTSVREKDLPLNNLAITHVAARENKLLVGVGNFGRASAEIKLNLIEMLNADEATKESRLVKLDPGENSTVKFEVNTSYPYKLELLAGERDVENMLTFDDEAYFYAGGSSSDILVVSDLSLQELGLQSAFAKMSHVSPLDYEGEFSKQKPLAYIFHRYSPKSLPPLNSLFVLPTSSTLFRNSKELNHPKISGWDKLHPLNQYLEFSSLLLNSANSFEAPEWMSPVIDVPGGSVMWAGESDGKRYAALGFEIFPYEGDSARTISVLTLNIINWLTGASLTSGYQATSYKFPTPGIFEKNDAKFAVNFFDQSESDLSSNKTIKFEKEPDLPGTLTENKSPVSPLLAKFLTVLLLLDLLVLGIIKTKGEKLAV